MFSQPSLFTATRLQTFTYLLAVCPFSIAFLVFINSSVSFVVTDLIGRRDGEGDAVGTLGFADELLALVACPLWGLVSDQVGVRRVCTAGYAIIAVALVVFVHARNVYPQLLLGRLLFSLGGSAVSTMVTAVLPAVTATSTGVEARDHRISMSSELTITPNRFINRDESVFGQASGSPSARLAGFVGTFAGCGALVSLALFLPLPAQFQKMGLSPAEAIQRSYYIVAAIALLVSFACFFGLRDLTDEVDKTWSLLFNRGADTSTRDADDGDQDCCNGEPGPITYRAQLTTAVMAGFQNRDIALGYIGGFVARASSVGISLFIPLYVNHYFRVSGLCDGDNHGELSGGGLGEIKRSCPKAYILASILTGVSQLVALAAAPAFGILSDKSRRFHAPLLFAASAGIVGYISLALLPSPEYNGPDGNAGVFLIMALIGISQIGAIVCSLAVLSNGILSISITNVDVDGDTLDDTVEEEADEGQALLRGDEDVPSTTDNSRHQKLQHLSRIKGSIAGVYSLWGGAGILLLTKVGGLLFDVASPASPFYFMAGFNALLLLAGITLGFVGVFHSRSRSVGV